MASPKVSLKLLVDTKDERVLFAEASKEVVDFLFNLLCLPVGTVVRLLTKKGMVGCLGNLYESVENLNEIYMQPNQDKDVFLKPRVPFSSNEVISGLLPATDCNIDGNSEITSKFYMCPHRCNYEVTCDNSTRCSNCRNTMNMEVRYVGKKVAEEKPCSNTGFVKEAVTYMVMDNLVIQPMSTISSITLLNKFNIKEIGALQEKVVELGLAEGIKILGASLQSKMVLTSVFLKN